MPSLRAQGGALPLLQAAVLGWKYAAPYFIPSNPFNFWHEGPTCTVQHAAVVGCAVDVEQTEDCMGGAAVFPESNCTVLILNRHTC